MQLGFNLSNRATDTPESSLILIYLEKRKVFIHRKVAGSHHKLKGKLKREIKKFGDLKIMVNAFGVKIKQADEEVKKGETGEISFMKFCANNKVV